MPTVRLSPVYNDQVVTSAGAPASGYLIYTYAAGSTSNQTTYTSSAGTVAQANPIVLNANGAPDNPIWLTAGQSYKFVLKDAGGSTIRTVDNVAVVNDSSVSVSQWVSSGVTPTYVSASSFTLVGDQTTEFHVGRRVQCTVTAGTVYGVIATSAYTALTTVTVTLDSGSLDSGLSAANLSILRADNSAMPKRAYTVNGLTSSDNINLDAGKFLIFEGTTDNTFETTLSGGDPTADRTITLPDATGTAVLDSATQTLTNKTISGANNTITGVVNAATAQNTTSGTAIDFTSIPSWVKRITFAFDAVSTNGTSNLMVQIGDSGGVEATGYVSAAWQGGSGDTSANTLTGYILTANMAAASSYTGTCTLVKQTGNKWVASGIAIRNDGAGSVSGGYKTLSDTLDRVRLTTVNGTDAFDAGSVNILYE